ncbi:unnamed protein product [Oikopleura dioica]|uniref:Nucleoporin NSP1-like C-terminal domain-containing protein n=2 Tax=Oikopleura dioica TaxID=34765 RepID=E4XVY0_OIKDI|nr:unnamed protein product [Oikopleura dioica]
MSGFSFGGGASKPASSGFSFGGAAPAASSTPATGCFSLGGTSSTTAPATTASIGGLFGGGGASALPKPAGGLFGGGAAAPATTSVSTSLSFGASTSKPAGGLFGAAATTASSLPKPSGLFGGSSSAPATTTVPASTGLGFGAKLATTGVSLGAASAAASIASSALPTPSISFTTPKAATTTAPSFTLGANSSTPATSAATVPKPAGISFGAAKPATATTSATTTTSLLLNAKPAEKTSTMTWGELDSKISRWNTEIHNQSQTFIKQATQVNAWTGILIQNGEKIGEINDELATVKKHQAKLDQELDRVAAQQNDLETILGPLEETAKKQKQINSLAHNVDNERERTFALAGSVDAQIKALALELREVIERVNSTHGEGEGSLVAQLTHILSSHTDALQIKR